VPPVLGVPAGLAEQSQGDLAGCPLRCFLAAAARSTLVAPYKPSARHLKFAQFDGTHILSAEFADEVAKVKNNV
jgi:hypothetical protein